MNLVLMCTGILLFSFQNLILKRYTIQLHQALEHLKGNPLQLVHLSRKDMVSVHHLEKALRSYGDTKVQVNLI